MRTNKTEGGRVKMAKLRLILAVLLIGAVLLAGCQYVPPENTPGTGYGEDKSELEKSLDEIEEMVSEIEDDNITVDTEALQANIDIIDEMKIINITEGDIVKLSPKGADPDGDAITYTFTKPLDAQGKWQTKAGDAGAYKVTVTASDGKLSTSQDAMIIVNAPLNQPPVLEFIGNITVNEGEEVKITVNAADPEGKEVKVTFSGWMTSATKKTGYDDAGTHKVKVTASDGVYETSQDVNVIVKDVNRPPVFVI